MNVHEKELLLTLNQNTYVSQRQLSELTGLSLGKVNKTIKSIQEQEYIDENNRITLKAKKEIDKNSPQNAIILAAGFGMRMVPINTEVSKGLLEVKGEPLVERIIKQLKEVGIDDITIVVGYLKESYEYLIDQYNVNLVVNMEYAEKNNLYSLNKVRDKIENTYIIPCDIYCVDNPFSKSELYSWYMVSDQVDSESYVRVNRKRQLVGIDDNEPGNTILGIAYICQEDAQSVRNSIYSYSMDDKNKDMFWEDTLFEKDKMLLGAKVVDGRKFVEIKTFEQLRTIDEDSEHTKSDVINLIADVFHTDLKEIKNITVLKKGMTNRSFKFELNNEQYIMRIPGQGTDKLIDRKKEYEVYETIKDIGICDDIYYMNPDNGYKITKYIEDAENCNDRDWVQVAKCMGSLRAFHRRNLTVNHTFDLFGQIEFYESLWEDKSCYRDYSETKKSVYALKDFVDSSDKVWTLTHIDANADNFLLWKDKEGEERITLIDWEYAAMQDAHLDIAMFAIYSMYSKEDIDRLIDCYFENNCPEATRLKIYSYIAIGGLLWSNWCEYKRQKGQEFGEYSIKQYRYAKEYSKIVLSTLKEENSNV